MCRTLSLSYLCKHTLTFRLSTCRGTYGTRDAFRSNLFTKNQPACSSATTQALMCKSNCGRCCFDAFEREKASKLAHSQSTVDDALMKLFAMSGLDEQADLKHEDALREELQRAEQARDVLLEEYDGMTWKAERGFPSGNLRKTKKSVVRLQRCQGGSPLRYEVKAEDVIVREEDENGWADRDGWATEDSWASPDDPRTTNDIFLDYTTVTLEEAELWAAANQSWYGESNPTAEYVHNFEYEGSGSHAALSFRDRSPEANRRADVSGQPVKSLIHKPGLRGGATETIPDTSSEDIRLADTEYSISGNPTRLPTIFGPCPQGSPTVTCILPGWFHVYRTALRIVCAYHARKKRSGHHPEPMVVQTPHRLSQTTCIWSLLQALDINIHADAQQAPIAQEDMDGSVTLLLPKAEFGTISKRNSGAAEVSLGQPQATTSAFRGRYV